MDRITIYPTPIWNKDLRIPTEEPLIVLTHENSSRMNTKLFSCQPGKHETFFPYLFFPISRGYHIYNYNIVLQDTGSQDSNIISKWSFKESFRKPTPNIYETLVKMSKEHAHKSARNLAYLCQILGINEENRVEFNDLIPKL